MKKLQFEDLVGILQNCFEEDLLDLVDSNGEYIGRAEHPLVGLFITSLYDSYDPAETNSEKIERFYAIIEDTRLLLNDIENEVREWEDNVDSSGDKYED
jgi:hypothetical protein